MLKVQESLTFELRLASNKAVYEDRVAITRDQVNTIKIKIQELEEQMRRHEHHVSSSSSSSSSSQHQHRKVTELTNTPLHQTHALQDATIDSVTRSILLVEESKDAGEGALANLQAARETMEEVERDVSRVERGLQRADSLIVAFGRKMCQDRIIQWISILNLLFIIGIVLYTQLTGKSLGGDDDNNNPQEPG